jgi:arylformamidase
MSTTTRDVRTAAAFASPGAPTMRFLFVTCFALLSMPGVAAEMQVHRDLAYAEPKNPRQTLDLYAPVEGSNQPVIVWIHGGGWRQGDKGAVQHKPRAFVEKGFVFVSVNYRLRPEVTVKEMTGDIARAIRWVHDHAEKYGGSPETIFVAGHSAGAHLAALVCTDDRYLKVQGLPVSLIKGCIPVDTAAYDVAEKSKSLGPVRAQSAASVFGSEVAVQRDLSPAAHVAKDKSIPPFLILHVADRPDSRAQSQAFAKLLEAAGVKAVVVAAQGKTHGTINRDLGVPGDEPTKSIFEFLNQR